jgi:hypothetical protein
VSIPEHGLGQLERHKLGTVLAPLVAVYSYLVDFCTFLKPSTLHRSVLAPLTLYEICQEPILDPANAGPNALRSLFCTVDNILDLP